MTNEEALKIAYFKRKDSAGEERDFLNTIIKALEQTNKIADIVDGTIDHFEYDDAMDMLYEIKGVIK